MNQLASFHFLRPEYLWALLPLLLLIFAIRYLHKQQSGWQSVLAGHLYQHLITSQGGRKSRPPLILLAIGWLLAVVAIAGPTWERLPQPVYQLHSGKVVVMDMSLSMRATDIAPDRLTRAKYKAIDLVGAIGEGETGLVAYAGDAFTISPLSTDVQNLIALIPSLSPEIMPVGGSEPYLGLEAAVTLLTNSGYQQGEIFWITDGIENSQVTEVAKYIQGLPFRVSILAVGTTEGAPIKLLNGELMKDNSGAIVIPKLTTNNLKTMANKGNGRYAPLQADNSDIEYLSSQTLLNRETEQQQDQQKDNFGDEWNELGPYLVLLLLPLAAYSFRRGLLAVFVLGFLLPGIGQQAQANWWNDMWETGDQQGAQAYTQQDYAGAAEKFNDPMWKGASLYKDGDYQGALDAFSQSDSTEALYNQGNALAQLGELELAIDAYNQVLAAEPDHQDAKTNKELLEQQQKQQEQQQQENQDQQNQQQDQDQQQNQQNEDGQQGTGDGSEQQQSNNNQNQQDQPPDESKGEEQKDASQQETEQQDDSSDPKDADAQQAKQAEQQLTDEEKEQMQRMQNLLRKVPDDPAYLLKRKMQLENQQRRRQQVPTQSQRNW